MTREEIISLIEDMIKPLSDRVNNSVRFGELLSIKDGKTQSLQVSSANNEVIDNVKYIETYGITSKPRKGSELVTLNIQGNAGNVIAVTIGNRGSSGKFIPANTILTRSSDGLEYITISDVILNEEPTLVLIECKVAGIIGNCQAGEMLNFSEVIIGVESSVEVVEIGAGADDETDQDLLSRYLQYVRSIYHGGAADDYRKWALEVEGVNRAWVYPHAIGPGTVVVRVMGPAGFLDQVLLDKVLAHIETKRPVTAVIISVISPTEKFIAVEISNLNPNTDEIKSAIVSALNSELNLHAGDEEYLPISIFHKAILTVSGLYNYKLDKPVEDVPLAIGEVGVLGEVTWS